MEPIAIGLEVKWGYSRRLAAAKKASRSIWTQECHIQREDVVVRGELEAGVMVVGI